MAWKWYDISSYRASVGGDRYYGFGRSDADPNQFHLMTGTEPVGEGDGILAREDD